MGNKKKCTNCEVDLKLSQKITNVNYETTLDKDGNHQKLIHRNHLIEYFPIEENIIDLTTNYGLTNDDKKFFYRGLLESQIDKLNAPLNKFSFQILFEQVEYVIVELLSSPSTTDSQLNEPENSQQKTQTLDSAFPNVTFPSRIITPSPTLTHRPRGRTSTPFPDSNRTNVLSRSTPS